MNKINFYTGLFILMIISGCVPQIAVDFRYSNASGFGTQNGGFLQPGQMYIWDLENNQLEFLETVTLTPAATNGEIVSGSQNSTGVTGFEISGVPSSLMGSENIIGASVGGQSVFSVSGTYRENFNGSITAMSEYVSRSISQGNNPDLVLNPRDDNFRIVIINSALRAASSQLSVGGLDSKNPNTVASVTLNSPVGNVASISVKVSSSTSCGLDEGETGTPPICFFNVMVRDPHYEINNPRMQFRVLPWPRDALSDAFRNLR